MKVEGMLPILQTPEGVFAALHDPVVLARILPSCEGVEVLSLGRFRARIARKVGLLTLRVEPELVLVPAGDGRLCDLSISAASRIAGSVQARLALRLDREPLGTRLWWDGTLETTGLAHRLLAERADHVGPRVERLFQTLKEVAEEQARAAAQV